MVSIGAYFELNLIIVGRNRLYFFRKTHTYKNLHRLVQSCKNFFVGERL